MVTAQLLASSAMVSVYGRFDAHEVPTVRAALQQAIEAAAPASAILIDLTMTEFFDSRALVSLLDAHAAGRAHGVQVQLAGASTPVQAVMHFAGVTHDLIAA